MLCCHAPPPACIHAAPSCTEPEPSAFALCAATRLEVAPPKKNRGAVAGSELWAGGGDQLATGSKQGGCAAAAAEGGPSKHRRERARVRVGTEEHGREKRGEGR